MISDFQIDGGEGQAPEEGQHHGGGQKGRLSDFFFSYLAIKCQDNLGKQW